MLIAAIVVFAYAVGAGIVRVDISTKSYQTKYAYVTNHYMMTVDQALDCSEKVVSGEYKVNGLAFVK